jgi:hypothetical protein
MYVAMGPDPTRPPPDNGDDIFRVSKVIPSTDTIIELHRANLDNVDIATSKTKAHLLFLSSVEVVDLASRMTAPFPCLVILCTANQKIKIFCRRWMQWKTVRTSVLTLQTEPVYIILER